MSCYVKMCILTVNGRLRSNLMVTLMLGRVEMKETEIIFCSS